MSSSCASFMPPLSCAMRGGTVQVNRRGHPQPIWQHSVITYGSPHVQAHIIPFTAIVEGSRTGEERVIGIDDRRRSKTLDTETTNPATGIPTDSVTITRVNSADQKKLLRVSAELERTLEKLRQKTLEELKLRRRLSVARLKLEEEVDRRALTDDGLFEMIRMGRTCMQEQGAAFIKLLRKAIEERNNALQAIKQQDAQRELQNTIQNEMNELRKENKELKQQLNSLSESKTMLEAASMKLREENSKNETQFLNKVHRLESELMHTQAQLQKVKNELVDVQRTTEASEALIQQVRLFVQMVCQPHFYVVKDSSLQPVDRNRPNPTGYVLVPLTVLLQGYTLLSTEERQNLIDCYQSQVE